MKKPPGNSLADLAKLSHEIRTPLNVLLGVLDLVLDTPLNQEQQEYFTMMRSAGNSLMTVVNDLMEFSRIDSGELQLERIPFSLRALLDDTVSMLAFEATRKALRLRVELAPGLPDKLLGDPARLRQVIVNLVANAIKFSEAGEIVINVELGHDADRTDNPADSRIVSAPPGEPGEIGLRFSVSDQGPGISSEIRRGLFAPFHQADASTWREHGGSGLGLSIVARLVALMHGKVWLESTPGQGSIFRFTAVFGSEPAAQPSASPGSGSLSADNDKDRGLEVLVIEDNPLNRRFCEILLEQAGHRVVSYADALQALPLLAFWRPDVVLMDLGLPGMDGLAATAAIRREERQRGSRPVPVIALTAHVDAATEYRCREAGMDGCIAKPVDPAAVTAILARQPPPAARQPERQTGPARPRARPGAALPMLNAAPAKIRREHPNYPSRRLSP